ncbi:FAD-binding oxidoreductase [Telmatospirillum sp. J64-1]|uniref:FAD-binding oxidoreductase n=1 Tax=Telmatospirillum sp. J64-1 TaxID=2502183 RepID=UPI00115E8238|nr:FAD-binding oxidoreductase [Telmatospirillum sp. J64-1]
MTLSASLLDRFTAIVGAGNCLTEDSDTKAYCLEERGLFRGRTPLVLRPGSTEEVAALVKLCAAESIAIVPQGGNTGLVGGGIPYETGDEVVISLRRMNRVRAVTPHDYTMIVEAGCVLADIQRAAEEADRFFPLSLAAEGSCTIGGNLGTNAGGVNVLRYGNARDLVLGLEVVLPDGSVWNGLKSLRKDNTGYDLRHLFIGSEGTLGIITAAVLKLFPRPRDVQTALVAVEELDHVLPLLSLAREASGDAVTAFELLPRIGLEMTVAHMPGAADPFDGPHPWYVLIELSSSRTGGGLREALEDMLGGALENGTVTDAVLAESIDQRHALWRLREGMSEAQKYEGGSIKHDVSVPVSSVPDFIKQASAAATERLPGIRVVAFGHVGDGNIHFNLSQPPGMDKAEYLARWEEFNRIVHDIVEELGGSFSAEHGIGRLKRAELERYKPQEALGLMRKIKAAIDPENRMNPGKVL